MKTQKIPITLECYKFDSFEGRIKVKPDIQPEELLRKIENFLAREGLLFEETE